MQYIESVKYLRVEDIMKIENISRSEAQREFNKFEPKYICGIKFIDGIEYFKVKRYGCVLEALYYAKFNTDIALKVVEIRPKFYNVNDIMAMLSVGTKKAYQILNECPNTFIHGKLKWVRAIDFENYIDGLILQNRTSYIVLRKNGDKAA